MSGKLKFTGFLIFVIVCILLFNITGWGQEVFKDSITNLEKISEDPELMKKYIHSQKNINTRNKKGKTLLHYAAEKGYLDVVKLLLERGADINAVDNDGRTPLHEAVSYKAKDVIVFLVENGANLNIIDKEGKIPLSNIVFNDDKEFVFRIVNLFLDKGFDLKKYGSDELLNEFIQRGHRRSALLLLERGISFNNKSLLYAVRDGYEDVFRLLLNKGAKPKQNGIFQYACISGNIDIFKTLIEKGVEPTINDIDICLYYGHKNVALYLNGILKNAKGLQVDVKKRCLLKPNPGVCKAAFDKGYYDPIDKVCKEFTWGGCDGVVPFDSIEACKKVCETEDPKFKIKLKKGEDK